MERVDGERRHLSVMFCDLVESTAFSERLDPEDLRDLLEAYRAACAGVVERFGGHVAQYLGDGLVVYFSYPHAHEDDAERAVRAGLAMLDELERVGPPLERRHGVGLAMRIGIHTGPVLIGEMGGGGPHERLALGHTVNLAARLQSLAPPGSVVISASTLRLVRGLFVTEDRGTHRLKGVAEPVRVLRVLRASGARSRLDVAAAGGLTPLVGRERDLDLLARRWARAREGRGQVVLVHGEPGIGKSRLVRAVGGRPGETSSRRLEWRSSPYHENTPFHPVVELLREELGLAPGMSATEQLARLEGGLGREGLAGDGSAALLAGLLSLELPEACPPPELSAEAWRREVLEVLARWLLARPTLLVAEDLQWADPSTLELLALLVERVPGAPVLLVPTCRPGFAPSWAQAPGVERIEVQPLTRRETARMVDAVAAPARLPPALREQVVRTTDGVPLFVEELTRSVVESDLLADGPARPPRAEGAVLPIPSTLQDSLMARLDRLGRAKDLAQVAAVLGREFSYALLAEVSTAEESSLDALMGRLEDAGLVIRRGKPPRTKYAFRHALIQETARQSLLRGTRRALHARIAQVLEERFPAHAAAAPEELAHHCEEGGLVEQAVAHHGRAGARAAERSASEEAIGHLRRALALLRTLPEGRDRDVRELELQVALGSSQVVARGWGSPDAAEAYERARALCERVGETPQQFHAVRGLLTFYVARADLGPADELTRRLLRLAEGAEDDSLLLVAHQQQAIVHFYRGEPGLALEHHERALALYDPERHRALTSVYGEDLGVLIRIWMGWALWLAGHPDRALRRCEEAVALGREARHPFSLAYALLWTAVVHCVRREYRAAGERAAPAAAIAERQGFAFVRGGARLLDAWARMDPARDEDTRHAAVEDFRAALVETAATGTESNAPQILGHLAEECHALGRTQDARASLEAALATSARTSAPYWDAELLRLRGELAAGGEQAAPDEAEAWFRRALELARRQGARSLELRAATSLARLWQGRGRREAARQLLGPVVDAFAEGRGTRDLVEARALLEKLA